MNENETSLYPVVEPSAFPITNRNQPESTMLRIQEDPPATTEPKMSTDVDVLELDGEFDYEGYQVVRREFFAHTHVYLQRLGCNGLQKHVGRMGCRNHGRLAP